MINNKYSIDKLSGKYDIFSRESSLESVKQDGVEFKVGPKSKSYSLNPKYLPYLAIDKSGSEFTKILMSNFVFKPNNGAVDVCVAQFLNQNAGLTKNEQTGEYNSYNVIIEGTKGNIAILNGKTLTNISLTKDGRLIGYSGITKFGFKDQEDLPFIDDIGQSGKTTNLISAFSASINAGVASFQSAVVKATDYPPEAEVVRDEYHGTCVFFADKDSTVFGYNGEILEQESNEDYLMIPYIQSPDGKIKPEVDTKCVGEFFGVISQTLNTNSQNLSNESVCEE